MKIYKISKVDSYSGKYKKELDKLMNSLKDVEWGWYGSDNKKHKSVGEDGEIWWETYCVMSPEEVLKHKIGTCIDQTILEYEWVKENLPDLEVRVLFVQKFNDDDHMCLIFKDKDWFHFEHSWGGYEGIHGPYKKINEIIKEVADGNKHRSKIFKNLDDIEYGINADSFVKKVKYDFEKEGFED